MCATQPEHFLVGNEKFPCRWQVTILHQGWNKDEANVCQHLRGKQIALRLCEFSCVFFWTLWCIVKYLRNIFSLKLCFMWRIRILCAHAGVLIRWGENGWTNGEGFVVSEKKLEKLFWFISSSHRFQLDSCLVCLGAMFCFFMEAIVENENCSIVSSFCLPEVMIGWACKSSHLIRFLFSKLLNADLINCSKGRFWLSVSRTLSLWRRNVVTGKAEAMKSPCCVFGAVATWSHKLQIKEWEMQACPLSLWVFICGAVTSAVTAVFLKLFSTFPCYIELARL